MQHINKLYLVKKDTAEFKAGDLVESYKYQAYKTKTAVTDHKVIGKWECCGCNMYKSEVIKNDVLEYIGDL
jgi:hypothetical protein